MSEISELGDVILQIKDLREKSSYKKVYDDVLKTLMRKLRRSAISYKIVDNVPEAETPVLKLPIEVPLVH